MSASLYIRGVTGTDSAEFKKHFKAVKFCIENNLSFPIETSQFFEGKIGGGNLEDYKADFILDYIKEGVECNLPIIEIDEWEKHIKVSEIPAGVETIIITIG